jgi:hypothetical protein
VNTGVHARLGGPGSAKIYLFASTNPEGGTEVTARDSVTP